MKHLLLFGAGKSATVLIDYLISNAEKENWRLIIVDADLTSAQSKTGDSPFANAVSFDISNSQLRGEHISNADIIISLLPPQLHIEVAKDCLQRNKNLLTASYIDNQTKELAAEIKQKGLFFLYEMGLDPGIDHMSAMEIIDSIHSEGGTILSFQSHCGGLVAPESDTNPWHYKISWNPRNIVMAGKAGARYRLNGKEISLSYKELFATNKTIEFPALGPLAYYPNRDSIGYMATYGLEAVPTFIRTTLRYPDFMTGWKMIIDLGLTDESVNYDTSNKSLQQLFKEHLEKIGMSNSYAYYSTNQQLLFLGFFDETIMVNKGNCTAADILQFVLEKNLFLSHDDKDMIVMLHQLVYIKSGIEKKISSSLLVKGETQTRTAMAKTVGLPLGIATKFILNGTIQLTGLHIPTSKEIYKPVLEELAHYGVKFQEKKTANLGN